MNDFILRRNSRFLEATVDGELIGLEVERGVCYGFNGTATRVWALIEQPARFSAIRDRLLAEYQVDPETCERELAALIDELEADGLVAREPIAA